ncbi:MAG: RluA family pseudouridine synthase [Bacteroidales bacterium]|nr:RluA family pseudouridine synthase [Bacteroidales bacterium]
MAEEINKDINTDHELFEHYRFDVDPGQSPVRVDKFLMGKVENVSRNRIQNAAKAGTILVNDKAVKSNYKVKPRDIVTVVMSYPPREVEIIPEDIPVEIIYEDEDIIVINKAAGMVVHPGFNNYSGTLLNAMAFHIDQKYPDHGDEVQAQLVHRIDKNTSGVLLMAKNEIAKTRLGKQFYDHSIERKYIALVWGNFNEEEGTIEGNIGRSLKNRKVMDVFPDGDFGKTATTHYKVIENFGYVTAIECQLETGRTHQIRAHMKFIGHPLFNDEVYGGDRILKGTTFSKYKQFINNCFKIIPRQSLHAKSLGFIHPNTGEYMFFDSELPDDMQSAFDKWRAYGSNI